LKTNQYLTKNKDSASRRKNTLPSARPSETRATLWRTLLTFNVTRVLITIVLLIYLGLHAKSELWSSDQFSYLQICIFYLALAIFFTSLAIYRKRRFLLQLLSQVLLDIAVISVLYIASGGAKSGLAILYLFPLAGCAILAPLIWALFFASSVTLVLLAESAYQIFNDVPNVSVSQVGLYGAAFFAAVWVINRLADKLIAQEDLAARRGRDLRIQQAINRLIIADTGDGVLVVTRDGTVLTGNPAAERMLGLSIPHDKPLYTLTEVSSLMPIAEAFFIWKARLAKNRPTEENSSLFVKVKPGDDVSLQNATTVWGGRRELTSHLKLRFAKVEAEGLTEDRSVIFLQDVTEIENQAQQLKLASMGRLTASIAHEVRNPLSAISYAASLLREEISSPSQTRLLNIVGDNVARLNQMIEDILSLSRKAQSHGEPLALGSFFDEFLEEFRETNTLAKDLIHIGNMDPYRVQFDPLHLREVMMNLLSNALRYASGESSSIHIHAVPDGANRLELHVQDDGPAISVEVRAHLFEPFYTTSNKGTGLGLYLARELCLNNGAMLDYEYRMDGMEENVTDSIEPIGRFVITLAIANSL
jgi:two-component system sensor histidine kinase PilS (NtrC family)